MKTQKTITLGGKTYTSYNLLTRAYVSDFGGDYFIFVDLPVMGRCELELYDDCVAVKSPVGVVLAYLGYTPRSHTFADLLVNRLAIKRYYAMK